VAFTDAQKISVRRYLGYPLGYYQYNTALESMFDKIGAIAAEQAAVETILAELVTVDATLATGGTSATALGMLKQVDEVQFYDGVQSSGYIAPGAMQRARMLVERLRQCFGVVLFADYFAQYSPRSNEMQLG
jgi:hypothetical protein